MITTLLIIILATIFIVAVTIIAAQNTACKDCPFRKKCDELFNQNQPNLCQKNDMPHSNDDK
mgnify:FL=1